MAKKPYVSVVIPTYNRASYIGQSIDSVLNQEPVDEAYEVIVVDDGSSDDTAKIVAQYKERVRYFRLRHSGKPAVGRNFGVSQARGEIIAFQDSDDLWAKNKLISQVPLFKDKKIVLAYGNAETIDEDGDPRGSLVVAKKSLPAGQKFEKLLEENVISALTVMIRKDAFEKAGGFNENLTFYEDYELWLKIVAQNPGKIKGLPKTLGYYRQHSSNFSTGGALKSVEKIIEVYNSVHESNLSHKQKLVLENQLAKMHENWNRLKNMDEQVRAPFVSVVMSVYNDAKTVKTAIQSILEQTYADFEFLIIDDGSTDNSVSIIKSFQDPRIRLIKQSNHGLVYALNKGIVLTRGQFIARMDSDDISLPTRLEKEVSLLITRPKVGLVSTFFTYIDEGNSPTGVTIIAPTKSIDLRRSLYIVNPFAHGSVMFRRKAFDQAGLYSDNYGPAEDYEMWCRMANKGWELAQIPESLYLYRLSEGGISNQKGDLQHGFAAKIIDELWTKPFVYKGYRTIVRDAHYYKNLDNTFADAIFHQYLSEQYLITKELLERKQFKKGLITSAAIARLNRGLFFKLRGSIVRSFVRVLKAKYIQR